MIYSKSAEYAIRATIHLAQVPDGSCAMAKDIAQQEDVPAPFLAKILQELARKGLLHSVKGPSGGFSLKKKAADLRLLDVVGAVDGLGHYGQCVAGFGQCNEKVPCPLHDTWIVLHSRIMDYLERNTIGSLVKSMNAKKKAAAKTAKKASESRKALRTSL
jgi:Rrf2 family transcriptional regulator, iron-sulfur cluster assembly transcription factor